LGFFIFRLIFDNSGNLLTKENPDRVCSFLMPNLTVLINAFFENLLNGRNPNEVIVLGDVRAERA